MGDKSGIEWTEATWNPIAGCSLVSPGCLNCYAMRQAARILRMHPEKPNPKYVGTVKMVNGNAVWTGQVNVGDDEVFLQPLRWKTPKMIFVNSMSDLFHEGVSDRTIDRVLAVCALSQRHTMQILTKRSERLVEYFHEERGYHVRMAADAIGGRDAAEPWVWPLPNVWLGVSVENQATAAERIPHLLRTPAAVRWLSCEPLLSRVDFMTPIIDCREIVAGTRFDTLIHWVVVGGESGEGARPMAIEWAADLALQCQSTHIPFFMKQLGGVRDKRGELESFPPALRVRQYPKAVRA